MADSVNKQNQRKGKNASNKNKRLKYWTTTSPARKLRHVLRDHGLKAARDWADRRGKFPEFMKLCKDKGIDLGGLR